MNASLLDFSCQPLCQECAEDTHVLYVHFSTGFVLRVGNVRYVEVADDQFRVHCGEDETLGFRRADVYFTSCRAELPPPAP
jgi:hypothetical protein